MIAIYDTAGIEKLFADNPGKKIGKFVISEDYFLKKHTKINKADKACMAALRAHGCDIIVLHLIVLDICLNGKQIELDYDNQEHIDRLQKIWDYLEPDYIILHSQDFYDSLIATDEIRQKIDQVVLDENYQEYYQLTDKELVYLKQRLYWVELFHYPFVYMDASKAGYQFNYIIEEYRRKKYSITTLLVDWLHDEAFLPYASDIRLIEDYKLDINQDIIQFASFIKNLSYSELSYENLMEKATTMGGQLINYKNFDSIDRHVIYITYRGLSNFTQRFHLTFSKEA